MAKLLISGPSNSGKTTLLQTLKDVLIIANDGKTYPFPQAHLNITNIGTSAEFIDAVNNGLEKYNEKMGEYPTTLVIDSISKTLLDIEAHYLRTVTSFPYGPIGKDISEMMNYIEEDLIAQGLNVIFISHALKDQDGQHSLVNAGGSWGKKGGVISETDNAIYVEVKGKKRIIHFKNPKLLARSLDTELPDSVDVEDFNLQEHLDSILAKDNEAKEWSL